MSPRTIAALAILAALATPATAETVTGSMALVCDTPGAVDEAWAAIENRPDNMKNADVIEPLGCVMPPSGLTVIKVDEFGAVVKGILIAPNGDKFTVYIMEGELHTQ
jgi:hypothetical protein